MKHAPAVRRGVTMMEVALGTLLVGGVLAATLNVVGPTVRSTKVAGDELLASALAGDLIDEIAAAAYEEPGAGGSIGREDGENNGLRDRFDDVDDYHGWAGAPTTIAGDPVPGLGAGWLCSVEVVWVTPGDPGVGSAAETGVKRVRVRVSRNGVSLAERSILRTRSFDLSRADP
jgi:hypothetical protein